MGNPALRWSVALALALACPAWGEDPGVAPGVLVGIVPFESTEAGERCYVELLLARELEPLGMATRTVQPPADQDPAALLAARPDLDYLVVGDVVAGERRTASARVHSRHAAPSAFSAAGPLACEQVAAAVTQHLGSRGEVGAFLAHREGEARATLERDPRDHEALMLLGMLARFRQDCAAAVELFQRAATVRPADPAAHFNLALCHKASGDRAAWGAALERAHELDPQNPAVVVALGNHALAVDDFHRARGYYERALEWSRTRELARWNLAVLEARRGRFEDARGWLEAIGSHSAFFDEARAWISRLDAAGEALRERERVSLWSRTDLPEPFGVALLLFLLALVAAAFLAHPERGLEIGTLKVPALPERARKPLRVLAPLGLLLALSLYVPVWPLGELVSPQRVPPVFEVAQASTLGLEPGPAARR